MRSHRPLRAIKLDETLRRFPYLGHALRLVWQAARFWSVVWLALLLLQGLLPIATVYLTRALVNGFVALLGPGSEAEAIRPILLLAVLFAAVLLAGEAISSLTGWVRTAQAELAGDHIQSLIHAKAAGLDLAFFETPAFYDQLHRARADALHRPAALIDNLGGLLQSSITLLAMSAILLQFGPWVAFVLIVSTLPALYVVARYTLRFHRWRVENTAVERRVRYYDWFLTWHQSAAELRLFSLGERFRSAFQSLREKLRGERVDLARSQALSEVAAGAVGLLALGAAMAWMISSTLRGKATLGDLALFYQAFTHGQRLMRSLLQNVGEIYRNLFFLEDLFSFLGLQPEVEGPRPDHAISSKPEGELRFERVCFRYSGSQSLALDDFNLTVPSGQIAAVVGENGAGKSTMIKLLCRFYDPQAGSIHLGRHELCEYPLEALRRQITVLFQEPVRYHESAADNIAFGDLQAGPGSEEVEAAALAAGADGIIRKLPQGYETVLGKWFGGAELSAGEWQRIALARAFLRRAELVILDEPTSAMDSWAEAEWLSRFRDLVAGRTALIVTHRFTTARLADVIHVMEAGRVVESGTHEELMTLDGRYASSWRQQRQARSWQPAQEQ